jgi:phosphoribosylanthranilate isomerase
MQIHDSYRTQIKICGLTRIEDALPAARFGADFLGFIFAESPRRVTAEAAGAILRALEQERPGGMRRAERVGVFVNAGGEEIRATARQASLTMLQLHGEEDPDFCTQFELPVIKALRIQDRGIFDLVRSYDTPYILLEAYLPGKYGGTGVQANWQMASELVRTFPEKSFLLAGGLGPGNVRAAVSVVRPFAVDASSVLESRPGIKDRKKMKAFIEAVRNR